MIEIEMIKDRAALVKAIEDLCMELPDELLSGWVRWEAGSEIMIVNDPKAASMDYGSFKGGLGRIFEIEAERIGDIILQKRRLDARARAVADGLTKAQQKKIMDAVNLDDADDFEGSRAAQDDMAETLAELLSLIMNHLPLLTGSKQIRDEP
jgi:hypothetical protein